MTSLFLHHLDNGQAKRLLRAMAAAAGHLLVVNDLVRHAVTLMMVAVAARLVTRSDVVHVDASRSVRAGFTPSEIRRLARSAGLRGAAVRFCFPCWFLLSWRRST
jgi:hypothetical protein